MYKAGRQDRGDIEITFTPLPPGSGIDIELKTSVERLYGEKLRSEIMESLKALGVKDCRISAVDDGALPYVVQARVEAAVRLAKEEAKDEG